jgi:hypothetical protein
LVFVHDTDAYCSPGEGGPQVSQLNLLGARMDEFEGLCDEIYQIVVRTLSLLVHLVPTSSVTGAQHATRAAHVQEHAYVGIRQSVLAEEMGAPDLAAKMQDKEAYLQAIETLNEHLQTTAKLRHTLLAATTTATVDGDDSSSSTMSS